MGWGQAREGGLGKLSPPPPQFAHLGSEKWESGAQGPGGPAKAGSQVSSGGRWARSSSGSQAENSSRVFTSLEEEGKELAFMKFLLGITGGLPAVAWGPATGGSKPTWDRQAGLTGTGSRGGCGSHQELAEAVGPPNSRVPRSTLGGAHSGASIQVRPRDSATQTHGPHSP